MGVYQASPRRCSGEMHGVDGNFSVVELESSESKRSLGWRAGVGGEVGMVMHGWG